MMRYSGWLAIVVLGLAAPAGLYLPAGPAFADDDDGGDDGDDRDDDDDDDRGAARSDDDDDDDRGAARSDDNDDDDDDRDDDDDDDRDPEYGPYAGPDGPRPIGDDEILDRDGALARRAQIAALNPDRAALRRARRLGFTVLETVPLEGLDSNVVILAAPPGLTVRDSLARLRRGDRTTIYDYNHFYSYRPTAVAASGASTPPPRRAPLSERDDIVIGLIDVHVDVEHQALLEARIETASFSERPKVAGR